MSDPPPHMAAFRWTFVAVVMLVLVLVATATSWPDVAATFDPMVDGLRRAVYR